MIKQSKKLQDIFDELTDCQQEHIVREIGDETGEFEKGYKLGQTAENVWTFQYEGDVFRPVPLFLVGTEEEVQKRLLEIANPERK